MLLAELHTMHIVNCMYPPLALHVVLPAGAGVEGSAAQHPASPEQVEMGLLEEEVAAAHVPATNIYIYIYMTCDRLNLSTSPRSTKMILLQVPDSHLIGTGLGFHGLGLC